MRALRPEIVAYYLRLKSLTQKDAAIKAELSEVELSHAMHGRRHLSDDKLSRLAKVLRVPIKELVKE